MNQLIYISRGTPIELLVAYIYSFPPSAVWTSAPRITGCRHPKQVALKIIGRKALDDNKEIANEVRALRELRHRNVMSMYDVISTPNALVLVLEILSGGVCGKGTRADRCWGRVWRLADMVVKKIVVASLGHPAGQRTCQISQKMRALCIK